MWLTIFLITIMVLCLVCLVIIVARKFPQLANLDVDHLPQEKQARTKRQLLARRMEQGTAHWQASWQERAKPLTRWWGQAQLRFRIYVGKVERLWYHETAKKQTATTSPTTVENKEQSLARLIQDGEHHLAQGRHDQAEQLFIAAIKANPHSAPAYRGLADTYFGKGAMAEAKETYAFLLQLNPNDDNVLVKLAQIAELESDFESAIGYYQSAIILNDSLSPRFYNLAELLLKVRQPQTAREAILSAVQLEPKSPKYLDLLIETAILCNDQSLAESAYNELRLVNPENQKLDYFKGKIGQL